MLIGILAYYCLYITCMLAGFLFGLTESNVCRDNQKVYKIVFRRCVPIPQKVYYKHQKDHEHLRKLKIVLISINIQTKLFRLFVF